METAFETMRKLADLKPGDEVTEVSWRHRDGKEIIIFCRISTIDKVTATQIVLGKKLTLEQLKQVCELLDSYPAES